MMKKIALTAMAIALIACGQEEVQKDAAPATPAPVKELAKPAEATVAEVIKIEIEGNDQMLYNLKEIKAKAGAKVSLTLKHTGKLPKAAMGHNIVILAAGEDFASFATASNAAGADKEYLQDGAQVIAASKVIGGGESVTVEFTAPAAGTYDFLCTVPGHYAMMKGQFIVE